MPPAKDPRAERWPSGRRRQIANLLRGYPAPPRVRIPASPPLFLSSGGLVLFLLLALPGALTACKGPSWTIESRPPGAQVYLDGRARGKTPFTLEGVYPGKREIYLAAPGRRPARTLLEVRPGPPGWLFPLDFPLDLGLTLFTQRDRSLTLDLPPARTGEIPEPRREQIQALSSRVEDLARKRVE